MDWITATITIGDCHEAVNNAMIRQAGFGSILSLIPTLQDREAGGFDVQRIAIVPLIDGPGNRLEELQQAVTTLQRLVAEAPPVFVHCRAGRGRSPIVVAGYLMRSRGISADAALAEVGAKRKISVLDVMRELLLQLQESSAEPVAAPDTARQAGSPGS